MGWPWGLCRFKIEIFTEVKSNDFNIDGGLISGTPDELQYALKLDQLDTKNLESSVKLSRNAPKNY